MITFNVGPSKVFPKVKEYLQDAFDANVLSMPHRSPAFKNIMKEISILFKSKFAVPEDYTLLLSTSATETWQIIARSLTQEASYHFYSGSFGERWFQRASNIHPKSQGWKFYFQKELDIEQVNNYIESIIQKMSFDKATLCFTHNETSNGTQISQNMLKEVRQTYPNSIIAVDATSSMGGVMLQWENADFWYGSVQKCMGLPPGLAIMLLSPKAVERMNIVGNSGQYNSLSNIYQYGIKYQTTHTPNTLGIYLLYRMLQESAYIEAINVKTKQRSLDLYSFFENDDTFVPFINDPALRSDTVITLDAFEEDIEAIKVTAQNRGVSFSNGYGSHIDNTIRIANFPSITSKEILMLKDFFS